MDKVAVNLVETVKQEVSWYASGGIDTRSVLLEDDKRQSYCVVAVSYINEERLVGIVVLARIAGDTVIIEEDTTDRPLVEGLIHAGIPRKKIILAYNGEPMPEEA